MIKKILLLIAIVSLLFSFSGCSLFREKIVTVEENKITTLSTERKQELLEANLEILKTIHGESSFFTVAEFEAYATEFFAKNVIDEYFNKRVFSENNGKIISNINTGNEYDIDSLKLKLINGKTDIKNNEQSFDVELNDGNTAKIIKFTAVLEDDIWVLSNIYF